MRADLALGLRVIASLGPHDVGQACVVRQGTVLAVEALEGTDRMVRRAAEFGAGAVLVKAAKPSQDMRFDVPVIGVATVEAMRRAGATCLTIDSGRCLLIDGDLVTRAADEAGIAIVAEGAN